MSEKDHRLEDALAYRQGFLEGDELAAFEAHLRECPECQATLERVSKFLPALQQALTMEESESDMEVLAAVRAAAGPAKREKSPLMVRLRAAWAGFALTAAAVAYFVLLPLLRTGGGEVLAGQEQDAGAKSSNVAAPQRPPRPEVLDAGPDGGLLPALPGGGGDRQ